MAEDNLQDGRRWHQDAEDGLKMSSWTAHEWPRRAQDGLKIPKLAPKMALKTPEMVPKISMMALKIPKMARKIPKMAAKIPKMAPKISNMAPKRLRCQKHQKPYRKLRFLLDY